MIDGVLLRLEVDVDARNGAVVPGRTARVSNSAPAVLVERVGFTYGTGTVALDDVSLSIERGTSVGIVGPSGCGKTTLLQIIAGLMAPTTGTVTKNVGQEGRCPVSLVFQQDTLLPWLTVAENVSLYARFKRYRPALSRHELRSRAMELLKMVGIEQFSGAYPYQLSGGMKRRLAFVSAVAPSPDLLMLDEPFASVDEPTRVQIQQDVRNIISDLGMTVVLVTHDLAEAISLCDQVIIISRRPGTIYRTHSIPFGRMRNLLDLRHDAAFLRLYGELWQDLSSQLN